MTPFERLGLPEDADPGQVRRRYAELLRDCRPEDDPSGFQRLNEAYRSALALTRKRAAALPTDGGADVGETPGADTATGVDPPPPTSPARQVHEVDLAAVAATLLAGAEELATANPRSLAPWLEAPLELTLTAVPALEARLLDELQRRQREQSAVADAAIDALSRRFHWLDVLHRRELERRFPLADAWRVVERAAHRTRFAAYLAQDRHPDRDPADWRRERAVLASLSRPVDVDTALWPLVVDPARIVRVLAILDRFESEQPAGMVEDCLDAGALRFWNDLRDPDGVSRVNLRLQFLRRSVAALPAVVAVTAYAACLYAQMPHGSWFDSLPRLGWLDVGVQSFIGLAALVVLAVVRAPLHELLDGRRPARGAAVAAAPRAPRWPLDLGASLLLGLFGTLGSHGDAAPQITALAVGSAVVVAWRTGFDGLNLLVALATAALVMLAFVDPGAVDVATGVALAGLVALWLARAAAIGFQRDSQARKWAAQAFSFALVGVTCWVLMSD